MQTNQMFLVTGVIIFLTVAFCVAWLVVGQSAWDRYAKRRRTRKLESGE